MREGQKEIEGQMSIADFAQKVDAYTPLNSVKDYQNV
jgi:hypothetical protein